MMNRFAIIAAAALTAIGLTACSTTNTSSFTTSTTIDGITTTTTTTTITENGQTRKEVVKTVTDEDGNVLSVTNGDGEPIAFADENGTENKKETEERAEAEETEAAEAADETEAANETEAVAENEADEVDEADTVDLRARWHELFGEGAEGENKNGDRFFFAYDDRDQVDFGSVMIMNADMTELNLYYFGDVGTEDDAMVIYDDTLDKKLPFYIQDGAEEGTFEMAFMDGDVAVMHFVDQDTIINDMVGVIENVNI